MGSGCHLLPEVRVDGRDIADDVLTLLRLVEAAHRDVEELLRRSEGTRRTLPMLVERKEAAEVLGMGLTSFKKYVQPHLKMVRRGRMLLVPRRELERWIERNAKKI
jgi:hypothetical protein